MYCFVRRQSKLLLVLAVIWLLLLIPSCLRPKRSVMTWQEYEQIKAARHFEWPYVLKITTPTGELVYFGAKHTSDPKAPELMELEQLWSSRKPDIAFNEGGDPPTEKIRDEAVRKFGEPGLLRYLAAKSNVPIKSLDPTPEEEVEFLRTRFTLEQIKVFYLLRTSSQFGRFETPLDLNRELVRVLAIFKGTRGLEGSPKSVAELDSISERLLPGVRYDKIKPEWFDPTRSDNFLNEISKRSSEFRDRHMVTTLTNNVASGKRVFAVVGGTHVVMQERAIRSILHVRDSQ